MRTPLAVIPLSLVILAAPAAAQVVPANFSVSSLAGVSNGTAMAAAPNGDVYFCQQSGQLQVWQAPASVTTVTTFTVNFTGERGLIGVALDPAFATNRFVYVHYTAPTPNIHNRVSRITLNAAGTAMVAGSEFALLDIDPLSAATNHNGGAIHFGPDGMLYVAVGDNATSANAQVITNLKGKILRISPNPANPLPIDNPTSFAGISGSPAGNNRAIWAVGLRNPFTFAFQPGTGRMFINDVGESSWEEINDGLAGRNYGWSTTEGRFNQASFPNFTNPLAAYSHTNGALNFPPALGNFTGFAIAGGAFYALSAGAKANFPITFQNAYFFGDYIGSRMRTFDPASNSGAAFATGLTGIVDIAVAPDTTLLYLRQGGLSRITYTAATGACCAPNGTCGVVNGLNCAAGSSFVWGGVCTPNPCPQPTGACCAADGTCTVLTSAACGGAYQGDGTVCTPNPCPPPMGACCRGSICEATLPTGCSGPNTVFVPNSGCNAPANQTTPCCKADFNHSGAISVQDIFDFLEAYFSGDLSTDINISGAISVQDIFDFLEAYFNGCA